MKKSGQEVRLRGKVRRYGKSKSLSGGADAAQPTVGEGGMEIVDGVYIMSVMEVRIQNLVFIGGLKVTVTQSVGLEDLSDDYQE